MIEKKKFTRYDLDKDNKVDVITLKLNAEERELLNTCKQVLNQSKDGTGIKQLMDIGSKVLLSGSTGTILEIVFNNKRRNKRTGEDVNFD
jgi:hypothetical protein